MQLIAQYLRVNLLATSRSRKFSPRGKLFAHTKVNIESRSREWLRGGDSRTEEATIS